MGGSAKHYADAGISDIVALSTWEHGAEKMIGIRPDGRVVKDEQVGGGWKYKRGKNRKTYDAAIKERAGAESPDAEATDHTDEEVYEDAWIVIFCDEETIPAR